MTNWAKPRKNPVSDQQILDVYAETHSGNKTAKQLGISDKTVYRVLGMNQVATDGLSHYRDTAATHTDDDARQMREMYETGALMKDVLAKFGGTYSAAKSAIKRAGGTLRLNPRPTEKPGEFDEILTMYRAGNSQANIASKLGRSQAFVSRMLRINNEPTRGQPSGSEHSMWAGGEWKTSEGYVRVSVPTGDALAAMRDRAGYVLKHRLIVARSLGRALLPSETVHHVDGNPLNNEIGNLQLRQGRHGKHVVLRCRACGSEDLEHKPL